MLYDELLTNYVGELGFYQVLIVAACCCEEVMYAMQVMSVVFTAAVPDHYCRHPNASLLQNCSDETIRKWTTPEGDAGKCFYLSGFPLVESDQDAENGDNTCDVYNASSVPETWRNGSQATCTDWVFDETMYSVTMVTEWQLVCDKAWMTKVLPSVFLIGNLLGCGIIGWLADRIGRRKSAMIVTLPHLAVSVVVAFVPGFSLFASLRLLHGLLSVCKTMMSYLIAIENCGKTKRDLVVTIYFIVWALGNMLVGGIAYGVRNWRHLMLTLAVLEIPYCVLVFWFLPESPRWLYVTNRKHEADRQVRKMARINKTITPDPLDITEPIEERNVSPLSLCTSPRILRITLAFLFVWAVQGMTYYGMSLNTGALAGNPYVNFVISGAIEIPAYAFIRLGGPYLGRVRPYSACQVLTGLALLAVCLVPEDNSTVVTGLVLTGKFFETIALSIAFVYTAEVYPTSIRSIGLCSCYLASRFTGPIAPFILLLAVFHPTLPMMIFGGSALAAGLVMLPMPETKGQPMLQTIEEADLMLKHLPTGLSCGKKRHPESGVAVEELLMGVSRARKRSVDVQAELTETKSALVKPIGPDVLV